jgi:hypothetical protein
MQPFVEHFTAKQAMWHGSSAENSVLLLVWAQNWPFTVVAQGGQHLATPAATSATRR